MIFELLEKIDKKYPFDLSIAHCGFRMFAFKKPYNSSQILRNEMFNKSECIKL